MIEQYYFRPQSQDRIRACWLRGREVAALTLEDIDWERERLRVPERKAGHSTAYPLSAIVGEAIVDYLKHGRPQKADRRIFYRVVAPWEPMTPGGVSGRASYYLHKAGVAVPRPGSHTLRHTCVQRLIDAHFSLKTIGDYVGHGTPESATDAVWYSTNPPKATAPSSSETPVVKGQTASSTQSTPQYGNPSITFRC